MLGFLLAVFLCPAAHAAVVPFGTMSTDPNAGLTVGPMPVWLKTDGKGGLGGLLAPSLTYNPLFGWTPSVRGYLFPDPASRVFAVASQSQNVNYRYSLRTDLASFAGGLGSLSVGVNHAADGSMRFYGFGADAPGSAASMYTLKEDRAFLQFGRPVAEHLKLYAGWEWRQVGVGPGLADGLPQVPDAVQGNSALSGPRVGAAFDTRDCPSTPTRGALLSLYAGFPRRAFGSTDSFYIVSLDTRRYLPQGPRNVLAMRLGLESRPGGDVPFAGLATLGGDQSLRGFGDGRFLDRNAAIASLEERWAVATIKEMGTAANIELAPFVEAGALFDDWARLAPGDLIPSYGIGFRAVVRPTVVGKLDIGWGRDGRAIFAGIDYPF